MTLHDACRALKQARLPVYLQRGNAAVMHPIPGRQAEPARQESPTTRETQAVPGSLTRSHALAAPPPGAAAAGAAPSAGSPPSCC